MCSARFGATHERLRRLRVMERASSGCFALRPKMEYSWLREGGKKAVREASQQMFLFRSLVRGRTIATTQQHINHPRKKKDRHRGGGGGGNTHGAMPVRWLRTSSTVTSPCSSPGMTKSSGSRRAMGVSNCTWG